MTPTTEFRPEIESLYAHEFNQYHASVSHLRDTLSNDESQCSMDSTERALLTAFEAMDQQLSEEALAFLLGPEMSEILQRVPRWDCKLLKRKQCNIKKKHIVCYRETMVGRCLS